MASYHKQCWLFILNWLHLGLFPFMWTVTRLIPCREWSFLHNHPVTKELVHLPWPSYILDLFLVKPRWYPRTKKKHSTNYSAEYSTDNPICSKGLTEYFFLSSYSFFNFLHSLLCCVEWVVWHAWLQYCTMRNCWHILRVTDLTSFVHDRLLQMYSDSRILISPSTPALCVLAKYIPKSSLMDLKSLCPNQTTWHEAPIHKHTAQTMQVAHGHIQGCVLPFLCLSPYQ